MIADKMKNMVANSSAIRAMSRLTDVLRKFFSDFSRKRHRLTSFL